ncbi:hypothetical protein VNO77_03915 [Canavalia gladiata]|uniref:Uncharacterized protein n=1 Tax=Canavalia gladiata TaxID=3824 RepID=A0AAN9MVK0_CANGL
MGVAPSHDQAYRSQRRTRYGLCAKLKAGMRKEINSARLILTLAYTSHTHHCWGVIITSECHSVVSYEMALDLTITRTWANRSLIYRGFSCPGFPPCTALADDMSVKPINKLACFIFGARSNYTEVSCSNRRLRVGFEHSFYPANVQPEPFVVDESNGYLRLVSLIYLAILAAQGLSCMWSTTTGPLHWTPTPTYGSKRSCLHFRFKTSGHAA